MDPYNTLDTKEWGRGGPTVSPSDLTSDYDAHRALVRTCLKHDRLPSEHVIEVLDYLKEERK